MSILISFTISWTFFTQYNRIIRFSKGFEHAIVSIKTFEYDDFISKQFFDLSSELHINKYEMLFIVSSVTEIMEQYRHISQSNYIPSPEPVTITSALFFHYYKDYNAEGVRVGFRIRLPNIYIKNFNCNFVTFFEIDLRFLSKLDFLGQLRQLISSNLSIFGC